MSMSFHCHCAERKKPIQERAWEVTHRQHNHSAFNGYHWTASAYSEVVCLNCNAFGRTKARYVSLLKGECVCPPE